VRRTQSTLSASLTNNSGPARRHDPCPLIERLLLGGFDQYAAPTFRRHMHVALDNMVWATAHHVPAGNSEPGQSVVLIGRLGPLLVVQEMRRTEPCGDDLEGRGRLGQVEAV